MKLEYVKPVTETMRCSSVAHLLADSTKWFVDRDENEEGVGTGDNTPDPSGGAGAKGFWGEDDLWED